jgi:N-succinyldiaminopimelate aminotransferase
MARFPAVSQTTETLSASVFSAMSERIKSRVGPLYPLHVGDTWREPYEGARAESQRTIDEPLLHTYAPVQGEPRLLDAIVRKVERRAGVTLERETLCVMSGATSALSVVMQALLDPGDEVLLPAPFWPLVRGIIASRGAVPVQVPLFDRLRAEGGFDLERTLEAAVTPRTTALYLNSPHNPTGTILAPDELEACVRVAERHDLWVFCDEVYEELWFGEAAPVSSAAASEAEPPREPAKRGAPAPIWTHAALRRRAIVVHSLSKGYGLAGARVGWAHGPREAMRAIRGVQTFQVYCAPRPMQLGAARALNEGQAWLDETRALYHAAAVKAAAVFGVPTPAGGTFLFVDASPWLPDDATDALPLLLRAVDEAGVLLTPGGASGDAYQRWVRVCFTSIAPALLDEALAGLAGVLARSRR